MVTALGWLPDRGLAFGEQPGEEHGRFHLGARDRGGVRDPAQAAAGDPERGQAASLAPGDPRPHPPQRVRDAIHRPPADGRVPGEHGVKPLASEHAGEEPQGRPGVADVQDLVGLPEGAAPKFQGGPLLLLDRDAQGAQTPQGRARILGWEKPEDARRAPGDRPQDRRPMGDGLVSRHAEDAPERSPRGDHERRHDREVRSGRSRSAPRR